MKKICTLLLSIFFFSTLAFAQEDTTKAEKKEKIKKGFSFGGIPVIAYDTDVGLKYGALANLYHYGDGSRYPQYDHSLYLEWSRTTKGNGINQIIYDSEKLIPNMRVTAEVSYMTEKALHFFGFNGYNSYYNADFEDDSDENSSYVSRVFYRHDRKSLRLKADFQGNIGSKKLRWLAGIAFHKTTIASVDIAKLNEGKSDEELLPDVPGLYDYYVDWGIINADYAKGGNNTMLKFGLIYDTRDIEANPSKGIWEEVVFLTSPKAFGYDEFTVTALFLHRQYFTLVPNTLTFAYRLGYQTKLAGDIPYYLLPYYTDSKQIKDGFGGSKTIRGIFRNRVVGDGVAFGNFEFRWKAIKTYLFKQNFYIALSAFLDAGRVVDPYSLNLENVPSNITLSNGINYNPQEWFSYQDEAFHIGYGAGVRFALNENFIIAVDYGLAAKEEDGKSGLYIGLNWLF